MRHIRPRRTGPRVEDGRRQDRDRRARWIGGGIRPHRGRRHLLAGAAVSRRRIPCGHRGGPPQAHRQVGRCGAVLLRRGPLVLLRDRQGPHRDRRDRYTEGRRADAHGRDADGQRALPIRQREAAESVLRAHVDARHRHGRGHGLRAGRGQHIREDRDAEGRQPRQGRARRSDDRRHLGGGELRGIVLQGPARIRGGCGVRRVPEGR